MHTHAADNIEHIHTIEKDGHHTFLFFLTFLENKTPTRVLYSTSTFQKCNLEDPRNTNHSLEPKLKQNEKKLPIYPENCSIYCYSL